MQPLDTQQSILMIRNRWIAFISDILARARAVNTKQAFILNFWILTFSASRHDPSSEDHSAPKNKLPSWPSLKTRTRQGREEESEGVMEARGLSVHLPFKQPRRPGRGTVFVLDLRTCDSCRKGFNIWIHLLFLLTQTQANTGSEIIENERKDEGRRGRLRPPMSPRHRDEPLVSPSLPPSLFRFLCLSMFNVSGY